MSSAAKKKQTRVASKSKEHRETRQLRQSNSLVDASLINALVESRVNPGGLPSLSPSKIGRHNSSVEDQQSSGLKNKL